MVSSSHAHSSSEASFSTGKNLLRAIILGSEVFVTEIYSLSEETRVDFRTDYRALRYAPHDRLPDTIREALLAINHFYHLELIRKPMIE
jgi:hypothetical protein